MAVETVNPYASVATRDNIARSDTDPLPDSYVEARAREDLDARLTGDFAGGRIVGSAEGTASAAAASVLTLQDGGTGQDENQVVVLPEDVSGTFTLLVDDSGGLSAATAAIDLDATAAEVQAALDLVQTTSGGIVVTKVDGRRIFGLTWSHATEDEADYADTVVAVTETGERGLDNN